MNQSARKHRELIAIVLVTSAICSSVVAKAEYMVGADVSFLPHAEAAGMVFRENGEAKPGLEILRDHGCNWIRLRLFHTPDRLPNNLQYTLAAAQKAKALGFRFLLDLHYSDSWADPGKQRLPRAWEGLNHDELVAAVFSYSRDTIDAFRSAEVMPEMVQIGNEVIGGMLWPDGKLPHRWTEFAELLKAGISGVQAGAGDAPLPQTMIHIDRGGDVEATKYFFDKCEKFDVRFDVIGQSYYPWWHGDVEDLAANLDFMAQRYKKDIVLVEVAYNWRTTEYRDLPGPFPETPEGQREFLAEVDRIVRRTPDNRGKGIFWWEPAVKPGPIYSRGIFNEEGNVLPVIQAFSTDP